MGIPINQPLVNGMNDLETVSASKNGWPKNGRHFLAVSVGDHDD